MKKLLFTAMLFLGAVPLYAQIDFSPLEPYRNWHPPQQYQPRNNVNQQPSSEPEVQQADPEELEREAEREAKAEAKYEAKQLKKIQASWQPLSTQVLVGEPSENISIPAGDIILGSKPSAPQNLLAPLGKTMRSSLAVEDLRRTAAILTAATRDSSGSTENLGFLLGQASRAMQGDELAVIVPAAPQPPQAVLGALTDLGEQTRIMESAGQDRHDAIARYLSLTKNGGSEADKEAAVQTIRASDTTIDKARKQVAADQYHLLPSPKSKTTAPTGHGIF